MLEEKVPHCQEQAGNVYVVYRCMFKALSHEHLAAHRALAFKLTKEAYLAFQDELTFGLAPGLQQLCVSASLDKHRLGDIQAECLPTHTCRTSQVAWSSPSFSPTEAALGHHKYKGGSY